MARSASHSPSTAEAMPTPPTLSTLSAPDIRTAPIAYSSMGDEFPFKKVLIANRGEIAVRVVRACRDLGLTSVAVYSDADRNAPHVRMADEAIHLGPPPAGESYLNIGKILDAAKQSGAGAIHPGYGFLSENADFADACAEAGIIFVGPPGHVMRTLGEKTAAKRIAAEAGVPIVPGYNSRLEDTAQAVRIAEEIGYPILLKAAAGGGGKGIRFVHRPQDMEAALRLAQSEARGAFGDDTVYMEKAVTPARHIEVQIFCDTQGNAIHLGERECSIQRRHQKLIEESPSVALDDALRDRFTAAAVRLARAAGYVNAGTCEFLLGPDGNFYFLEVNTRLQVEHPVTEWRTGLDLVREQLRVAAGLPLSFAQDEVSFRGHAIEARITAEDPLNRFLPATGLIAALHDPAGPGVRLDSGIYAGMEIPLYYDSLLAKLICWGADREEALARLRRALDEYTIAGLRTTIPFHRWLLDHPRFQAGDFSTDFIAEEWQPDQREEPGQEHGKGMDDLAPEAVAALVATLVAHQTRNAEVQRRRASIQTPEEGSRWRAIGRRSAMGGW